MKTLKKIIIVLVLSLALFIIFYPTHNQPDIRGTWSVNTLIAEGKEKIFTSPVNIYDTEFYVNEFYMSGNVRYKYKVVKDSFFIFSPRVLFEDLNDSVYHQFNDYRFFEGRYKMEVVTKMLGSGKSAQYDTFLKLVNKDKSIVLERETPVQWPAPIRRGQP